MTPTKGKAAYVLAEAARGHDGSHRCHAERCETPVAPAFLMCRRHWRMVPKMLRDRVWKLYRPGQEIDKRPTEEYLGVLRAAVRAVTTIEDGRCPLPCSECEGRHHPIMGSRLCKHCDARLSRQTAEEEDDGQVVFDYGGRADHAGNN